MNKENVEKTVLEIAGNFLRELDAQRSLQDLSLDANIDRTLGIDSLGKVEILHRIEEQFNIKLPQSAISEARTLRDLAKLVEVAQVSFKTVIPSTYTPAMEEINLDVSIATTLAEVISLYGTQAPNRTHIYLQAEDGRETLITYGELYARSQAVALGLLNKGIQPGETVAIMLPTEAAFFYAFCGAVLAGAVPVPIYPPFRPDQIEDYAKREAKILHNADARLLITFTQAENLSRILQNFVPSLIGVMTLENLIVKNGTLPQINIQPTDPLLIQYTSGSTGDPKGVLLSQQNFLANIRALGKGIPILASDSVVSWLPLYHDMGLMNWLGSLYFGLPLTLLSPLTFLTRPERWLWAIHYHRATLSGGPNFAYELCIRKINEKNIEGLDLSSWRFAFNGAEAVNPKTLENFSKKFAHYGFKPETFAPVYGLAENTVSLTLPPHARPPRIDKIQKEAWQRLGQAIPATGPITQNTLEFVSCGIAIPDHEIRIVNDQDDHLPERIMGNIQFKGPSAMQAYYHNASATQKSYHAGWWDTGDLGYLVDNELFITGRKKDLIIKAGRNLSPEEIEDVVGQITGIRKGCVVAFGVSDEVLGTEKLVVVAEAYDLEKNKQVILREKITQEMTNTLGIPPDTIALVPPRTVQKTSSGKLKRSACKQAFLDGKLIPYKLPISWQVAKLALASIGKKIQKLASTSAKAIYSAYIGLLLALTSPVVALCLLIFKRERSGKILKFWARSVLRLAACPLTVSGNIQLAAQTPVIYVANHASYVDSLVLLAVLPAGIVFTTKQELLKTPLINIAIKKLGFITIEREDFAQSVASKKQIENALKKNQSIIIFPEGTFTYATGLRPFKLGAFIIAAETTTPLCTVSIQGTRFILRGDDKLLRPGKIKVIIGKPIYSQNHEWSEVLRLLHMAREEIAQNCGESAIGIHVAGI